MSVHVDTHELKILARDLDAAGKHLMDDVAKITEDSLTTMERDAKAAVRGYETLPHLARSFNHDLQRSRVQVDGEVGADVSLPQGKLDVFIEYGTPTSNPHPHWTPAHDRHTPPWIDKLERATADAIERRRG